LKIQADPAVHNAIDAAKDIGTLRAIMRVTRDLAPVGPPIGGVTLATVETRVNDLSQRIEVLHEAMKQIYKLVVNLALPPAPPPERPGSLGGRIVLLSTGNNKIGIIKAIRAITGLGLKEAKDVADACESRPQVILPDASPEVAQDAIKRLNEAGGTVQVGG
jgi:ribosomal protein L7/L12